MSIRCISDSLTAQEAPVPRSAASWDATPKSLPAPWLMGAAVSVVAAAALGMLVRQFGATQVFFAENGPIEFLQAACLMVIAAVFATVFLRSRGSRALFCLLAVYGIVLAVTREVPRCGSTFYEGGMCLSSGWKTGIVLAASAAALLALVLRPIDWREALRPVNLRWVWPSVLVVIMLVAAEAAEEMIYVEIEEALELTAYAYLGAFGLWIWAHAYRPALTAGHPLSPLHR